MIGHVSRLLGVKVVLAHERCFVRMLADALGFIEAGRILEQGLAEPLSPSP